MKLNIQLFAEQTILSSKQSTSGSPYVIYTVKVTPSNRTLTSVDLAVSITAHLKNADSTLGTGSGYGIKGKLTVASQELWFDGGSGNGPLIKGTGTSWSGTSNHTVSHTFTVSNLSWSTTALTTTFYAIRTSGNTNNAGYLKTTDCTAITIDRAAAPSTIQDIVGGGGTTDYTPTIKWTPYDASFIFKIKYAYGSWSYTTSDYIRPNTTGQFPYSGYTIYGSTVAPYMAGASGTFTATLYTYDSGGNYIGESNANFTVTLNPNTYKPTASIGAFSDAGGIVPSSWGIFVQGKSKLSFNVSASASAGSSISSYSTVVNGKTYTTTSITTDWLSSSGSANLTVTDSRGRTGTASSGYSVVAYATPDIDLTGYRAGSSGTASDDGTYYHYSISGHIQSCKNGSTEKNSVSEIKIGYRVAGSSSAFSYTTISATMGSTSNNRVAFTAEGTVFGGNISTANNYEIRAYLKDGLGVESSDSESVGAEFKLISYKADGTGIAIGKKATVSNKVEVNMDVDINGQLSATGSLTTTGNDTGVICDNQAISRKTKYTVSAGGNAGIYDMTNSSWIIKSNTNQSVEIPHPLSVSGTITGDLSGNSTSSSTLASTGTATSCLSYIQTSGSYFGATDWAHYIIANHGDGATYYNYMLRLPFGGSPQYQRQTGNTSARTGWKNFWTNENNGGTISGNGYMRFENGLTINWGTTSISSTSSAGNFDQYVGFAKAFSQAPFYAAASRTDGSNHATYTAGIGAQDQWGLTIRMSCQSGYAATWGVKWIAVGIS